MSINNQGHIEGRWNLEYLRDGADGSSGCRVRRCEARVAVKVVLFSLKKLKILPVSFIFRLESDQASEGPIRVFLFVFCIRRKTTPDSLAGLCPLSDAL